MKRFLATFHPKLLDLFAPNHPEFKIRDEVLSGITVGLVALPLSFALGIASIPSGVTPPLPPPTLGILTAIIAGFFISAFGGSRVQIGGPTAAFIPIILLIVQQHGYTGLLISTIMAGVILILMGFARMGNLIRFIPWPVTSGFTTGIAVCIMLTQVSEFAGLRVNEAPPIQSFHKIEWLIGHLGTFNSYSLGLSLACLIVIALWPKLKIPLIPGFIAAVIFATLFVAFSGWGEIHGIATIGNKYGAQAISSTFPAPVMPEINWALIRELIGPATTIALLGAIVSLLSAVVGDGLCHDRHDSNTELIAQGIANIICPLFGGLPATGAVARTSANVNNGGKVPISGIVHALTLLLIVVLAAHWATYIPMAAMSAVLVFVSLRMGQWHQFRRLNRIPLSDALVFLTTFTLTVVFDLVIAMEIGMVLAAILFIRRISETTEVSRVTTDDMLERPEQIAQGKCIPEGVLVYRIFGPFLFGAAKKLEDAIDSMDKPPRVLILRLHLVTAMDATGLNALEGIVSNMRSHGCTLILGGIHQQPLQMIVKAGFLEHIGKENFCATFDESLERANALLRK